MGASFDDTAFFGALEERRQARNLSWRQLGRELELSPSTFTRLARGRRPDVDTFLKLLAWLDVPAERFMHGAGTPPVADQDTIEVIATALRSDHTIAPEAAGAMEQLLRLAYSRLQSPSEGSRSDQSRTIDGP